MRHTSSLAFLLAISTPLAAQAGRLAERAVPLTVASGAARQMAAADQGAPMHLSVSLQMRDRVGLAAFAHQVSDPDSPLFRQFLTVRQVADRFGPSMADYAAAADFFRGRGFAVRADAANRFMIQLDGKVADVERVFHVKLNRYQAATGRLFTAPDREPTLDAELRLLEVSGMDDAVLPTSRLVRPGASAQASRIRTGSGPGKLYIGSDMRAAYYGAGPLTGAGQTVGMMELQPYNPKSPPAYFKSVGQPLNVPIVTVATDSETPTCSKCDDGEQALDIEYAISMAPALSAMEVYVGNPEDVLNSMASRNTASVLSTSWGWGERFATDDTLFLELAAQGQTMLNASGDDSSLQASGPWPEEDANIISVGGTHIVTDGPGGPLTAETGWGGSAGGPSVDHSIKIEPYQVPYVTKVNEASSNLRNVPDIAASASIDMYLCIQTKCSYAGGTSYASPIWAGFVALADQQAASLGQGRVGFINPLLYKMGKKAEQTGALRDIVKGTSGDYRSTRSFDLVTGLGSPTANLIPLLVSR